MWLDVLPITSKALFPLLLISYVSLVSCYNVMFLQHLYDRIIFDKVTESDNLFEDKSTNFPAYQKYNYDNGYKWGMVISNERER